jgi:hypothetical protein
VASGTRAWLAIIKNTEILHVFQISKAYDSYDAKKRIYSHKLIGIEKIFYDDLGETIIDATGSDWGAKLDQTYVICANMCAYASGAVWTCETDRIGFSVGDMIESMGGTGSQNKYYFLDEVTFNGPKKNVNGIPILHRGVSRIESEFYSCVDDTFTLSDPQVTWLDIFKVAIFIMNAWVSVRAKITAGKLAIDVIVRPKSYGSFGDITDPLWIKRKIEKEKYRIDGVHLVSTILDITGEPSQEFQYGDEDGNVFERSVDVANPNKIHDDIDKLFLSIGNYNSGSGKYIITDGDPPSQARPYFGSGHIAPYYVPMTGSGYGNGITGQVLRQNEQPGDFVNAGDDVMQIVRLRMNKDDRKNPLADIEGIIVQ